ncbi:hypothetical protein STXM2123_1078 [Streptomyces sp. F-3]|nr:hypothetical protein STXM2123_1078 [Streptomyces sp. F-3]
MSRVGRPGGRRAPSAVAHRRLHRRRPSTRPGDMPIAHRFAYQ